MKLSGFLNTQVAQGRAAHANLAVLGKASLITLRDARRPDRNLSNKKALLEGGCVWRSPAPFGFRARRDFPSRPVGIDYLGQLPSKESPASSSKSFGSI